MKFVTYMQPMGKPRMTRRDKWKQRPCVIAYRAWCDRLRMSAGLSEKITFVRPHKLRIIVYFQIPASWPKRIQEKAAGQPHACKPDLDNVTKGVQDALFENDQNIYAHDCAKFWNDGAGARIEVTLEERS